MEKNRIRPVKSGKSMRMSYSRQKEVLEMPNLIEVQKDSYQWFLNEGLKEVFSDISPIADYNGRLSLEFVDFALCEEERKYSIEECKERDATYAAPLKVRVRLHNKESEDISEHEIFMGDLPLMTKTGTFVINGAERVIVSQLVRSTFLIGQMYNASTGEPIETDHGFLLNHTIDVTMLAGTEYDGTTWGAVNQHDGARCQKWPYSTTLTDAMGNDFHVFRYADVLLMKAEALLRSGGSASEATSLVNQVRERAFGDSNHNYATVTLDDILLERRLELSWEMHNRQDDIRFGAYDKGMWAASNCVRKTDAYLKLFPISQDAYQSNDKLTQNPGYPAFK